MIISVELIDSIANLIRIMCFILQEQYLHVNCAHLTKAEPDLARQLRCYPQDMLPTMDMALSELFNEKYPDNNIEVVQVKAQR